LEALGSRIILPPEMTAEAAGELGATLRDLPSYEAHRIALSIPRGGIDFIYNDAFPHEADLDQLGGLDFDKGCYVGQEVVSRTQHRGSARTRIVGVAYDDFAPEAGVPLMAGEKQIGTMGSAKNERGLATLRLDRLGDAIAAGVPIMAGGIKLRPFRPAWAKFEFPEVAKAG
jgi:folate-binding protein YgfZ